MVRKFIFSKPNIYVCSWFCKTENATILLELLILFERFFYNKCLVTYIAELSYITVTKKINIFKPFLPTHTSPEGLGLPFTETTLLFFNHTVFFNNFQYRVLFRVLFFSQ